jgi:hypothetical protein
MCEKLKQVLHELCVQCDLIQNRGVVTGKLEYAEHTSSWLRGWLAMVLSLYCVRGRAARLGKLQ